MANQTRTQTQPQNISMTQTGNWYMITSPHTKEQCLQALDDVANKGQEYLSMWRFGCKSGDHTAYAFVRAESPEQAINQVPDNVRNMARVEKVDELTVEQIRDMHK